MITIVHYGLGNIQAFINTYNRLNIPVKIAQTADELSSASKIILPGVGAFDGAMGRLNASGMKACLNKQVLQHSCPVLGVCVGMHMMAKRSEEGDLAGLGWFDAEVKRFDETHFQAKTYLPHMGWNDVAPVTTEGLFNGIDKPRYYFLHAYYFAPNHPNQTLATTDYQGLFTSAVKYQHIYGVQFHPEKSHQWGIQLLKNFAEL